MADVLATAERFRARLRARERTALLDLARSYRAVEQTVAREVDRLTRQMRERTQAGEAVPVSWIHERGRLSELGRQVRLEVTRFTDGAQPAIEGWRAETVEASLEDAGRLITVQAPQVHPTILRPDVVEQITAGVTSGSPLRTLLAEIAPLAEARLRDVLVTGVTLGHHPRQIARDAREVVHGLPRSRALTIARTEALRAYREASRETWIQNRDLVAGWVWLSAMDKRTCSSCLAMNGTFHPLDEAMSEHPAGRCTMVPEVHGGLARYGVNIPTGDEVFRGMSPDDQLAVVGPSKLAALRGGRITLADTVRLRHSPRWGDTRSVASLPEAVANARRRRAA